MSSTRRAPPGLPVNPRSRLANSPNAEKSHASRRSQSRNPHPQRGQVPDTHNREYQSRRQDDYHEIQNVRSSGGSTSTSSSEPSFWARDISSHRSSGTSIDEGMRYSESGGDIHSSDSQDISISPVNKDVGYWTRVTDVANVLTQEVSKAWSTSVVGNGVDHEDEAETESHLVNVMRAYHLSKARTPGELPDWLFSERERGRGGSLRPDPHRDADQVRVEPTQPAQRRNRPEGGISGTSSKSTRSAIPLAQAKASGADRLKQMRELRRSATGSRS